jgi:hypothetical protein
MDWEEVRMGQCIDRHIARGGREESRNMSASMVPTNSPLLGENAALKYDTNMVAVFIPLHDFVSTLTRLPEVIHRPSCPWTSF